MGALLLFVTADKLPPGFPQITQPPQQNKVVEVGHSAMLNCQATGNPPPKIYWVRNMLPIDPANNPRYTIGEGQCHIVLHYILTSNILYHSFFSLVTSRFTY